MKKLIIKSSLAKGILDALNNDNTGVILNKAVKYIKRWPKKTGKGWDYLYPRDFSRPLNALFSLFGLKKEKIMDDYTKNNIKKNYGADKKTFASHVLEYFSNKLKWDAFFAKKENREKTGKPRQMAAIKKISNEKLGSSGQGELFTDEKQEKSENTMTLNRSLMRKVWELYNPRGKALDDSAKPDDNTNKERKDGGRRQYDLDAGQGALPATPEALQSGRPESQGGGHGDGAVFREAGNGGDAVQRPIGLGERSGRDVRVTKKQAKDIRQACLDLLNSKSDSEMTEEDKALLRQYEGAGGLGSEDASVHGTLYEFYTPRTVTSKVWEIVDKYIPGAKSVLEPSAGIGRFAEDRRNDKFTLNEYDQTSSRISGILHPDAEIKHGAFQEMFKPGKDYTGKKYDVVIGNPPYGKYQGLWKGRGEGKGHTRYEEYFIDRGLDTLREGGIMAFVVPSSFLRGGNDKVKEKIAGKGRLLEAWRLPNGTFNTTGVGTDIIIVRKEKGESDAFSNNTYFEKNPLMVAGDETTRTGRFGEEKYVGLKDGVTFDEAIEGISAGAVEAVPIGEQTAKEKLFDNTEIAESEAEKHANRSRAMMGNDNAKKLIFDLINSPLRRALKYDDVDEYETAEGGIGYVLMVRNKAAAQRAKARWEKDGGYASFDAITGKLELSTTPLFGQDWRVDPQITEIKEKIRDQEETIKGQKQMLANMTPGKGITISVAELVQKQERRLKELQAVLDNLTGNTKTEAEKHQNRSDAMKGNDNAKKDGGPEEEPPAPPPGAVDTLEEFNRKYNKHFDPKDLKIMRHTRWDGTIDLDLITPEETSYMKPSGNYVDIGENTWMSAANFASGNIYQKLDDLETAKEGMPTAEYKRQKDLLEAALPVKKSVFDFTVSPISDFAEEYRFADQPGEPWRFLNAEFKRWFMELDSSNIPSEITKTDILDYVNRKAVRAERSDDKVAAQLERAQTVRVRREAAENLFNQFIREQLAVQEQERMADKWNRQFNGTVQPDHTKIPAFVDGISKTFKGKPLRVSDIQLKGVGTLVNRGNGILAYDVGVGKTLTGILATVSQIQTGRAKRPLICVPKAVYKNWISEIKQLFPGIKINELNNLRSLGNYKNADGSLNVPEGSLSVCTYEGLQAISFKQETIDNVLGRSSTSMRFCKGTSPL